MIRSKKGWCGNENLQACGLKFQRCSKCETLLAVELPEGATGRGNDDEAGFYGRQYWFAHMETLGYPNLTERSRTDLPERCLHWLRTALKYKLPPGKSLELGSAHGGFVGLLTWSGFDAIGLELSPWVAEYARKTYGVPMLLGTIADQPIQAGVYDLTILMDVLEHLCDPVTSMRNCLNLLKGDGLLVIQTPRYPEGKAHGELVACQDPFLEQLKELEHLFLFSQTSIREFFRRLGAEYLSFEPAIFSHYDMFLVVSRKPLMTHSADEITAALTSSPDGRLILALLDLDDQRKRLLDEHQQLIKIHSETEADRAKRLEALLATDAALRQAHGEVEQQKRLSVELTQKLSLAQSTVDTLKREMGFLRSLIRFGKRLVGSQPPPG